MRDYGIFDDQTGKEKWRISGDIILAGFLAWSVLMLAAGAYFFGG